MSLTSLSKQKIPILSLKSSTTYHTTTHHYREHKTTQQRESYTPYPRALRAQNGTDWRTVRLSCQCQRSAVSRGGPTVRSATVGATGELSVPAQRTSTMQQGENSPHTTNKRYRLLAWAVMKPRCVVLDFEHVFRCDVLPDFKRTYVCMMILSQINARLAHGNQYACSVTTV